MEEEEEDPEKKTEGHHLFHVSSESQEKLSPLEPPQAPSNTTSKSSQAKKEQQAEKAHIKKKSELAKNVQEQLLENKKLEKLCSIAKKKSLQLSLDLSQKQESAPVDPGNKFVAIEVTGSYYYVVRGKSFHSFGIYADVKKFLMEVNDVVGALFKVCESYSGEFHKREGRPNLPVYRVERASFLAPQGGGVSPLPHTPK
jgi:hypothetical protein